MNEAIEKAPQQLETDVFAIDNGLQPAPTLGRAFEFLNAESFEPFNSQAAGPFTVSMGMLATTEPDLPTSIATPESLYALGANLSGPEQILEERRKIVLTILVDVSGSMESPFASEPCHSYQPHTFVSITYNRDC